MKRSASAYWQGNLKDGAGYLSTESGVLSNTSYSFCTRFESKVGTNPEELIAAAHAGCFAMALSAELTKQGFSPATIRSDATLSLENVDSNWTITEIFLGVFAHVPGMTEDQFKSVAETVKSTCPVSRLLNAKISLKARLMSEDAQPKSA